MKKSFIKKMGMMISAAMLIGMVQLPAMAVGTDVRVNTDFTDGVIPSDIKMANGAAYEVKTVTGIGGKTIEDNSVMADLTGIGSSATDAALEIPYFAWTTKNNDKHAVTTLEMSILYSGDIDELKLTSYVSTYPSAWKWDKLYDFIKIRDGKVYTFTWDSTGSSMSEVDTGIYCQKDEWLRIVIEEHYNADDTKLYINGQQIPDTYIINKILGNRWTQLISTFNAGAENRSGYMAIDDVKIYNDAYTPTGDETVSYTASNGTGFTYNAAAEAVYATEQTKTADVLAAVTTDNTKWMQVSHNDPTAVTSETVTGGNVVVIQSEDGKTYDYVTVSTNPDDKITRYFPIEASSAFTMHGTTDYAARGAITGLYGKGEDNYAYGMTVTNLPATAGEISNRYNLAVPSASELAADSFTYEFSVGGEGDFDNINYLIRGIFTKAEDGSTATGYASPIIFGKDGNIIVNDTIIKPFRQGEWYRVAVTFYPKDCVCDVYLNGELAEAGFAIDPAFADGEAWDLTGFSWYQLQPIYKAVAEGSADRSGVAAFDDILIYYGEYQDRAENAASITSDVYMIDEEQEEIYIEDTVDPMDFMDGIVPESENIVIYTDNTYTEEAEDIAPGCVIMVVSENGYTYKYYTVRSTETNIGDIITYVNDEMTNILEAGTLKAQATITAPAYLKKNAVLILAVYKDGEFVKLVKDEKAVVGETNYAVSTEVEDITGISAKVMLWDSLGGLNPYSAHADFLVIE